MRPCFHSLCQAELTGYLLTHRHLIGDNHLGKSSTRKQVYNPQEALRTTWSTHTLLPGLLWHLVIAPTTAWLPFSSVPDCLYCSVEFGTLSVRVCVCTCVCSCLRLQRKRKLLPLPGRSVLGMPGLAKGTVTCLSVSADLFQLQALRSIRHVISTACCLRASCHKPPVKYVDSGHNTLHTVASDRSACLTTHGYNFSSLFFREVSNYIQILAYS